MLAKGNYDQD